MGLGRSSRALLLTVAVAACRFDTGGPAGAADDGGTRADADLLAPDAAIDASGNCDPASDQTCLDATMLQTCDGIELCADGCEPGGPGGAHCRGFHPHNGVDPGWLDDATVALDIPGAKRVVFDSSTGVIFDCSSGLFVRDAGVGVQSGIRYERAPGQNGGVNLGVFVFTSLRLHPGGEIVVVGADGFGVLVDGELRLESVLRAGGGATRCSIEAACGVDQGVRICSGAGGGDGGEPNANGQGTGGGGRGSGAPGSAVLETGGGGGGFGLSGGAGGGLGGGGPGGDYGEADCEPLMGGSGGGGGGFGTSGEPGLGGGGGGAVQLTSRTKIRIDGLGGVEVGGGGGGPSFGGDGSGAGGGGAGGMVLLEAPVIDVGGTLAANGGGGGAGDGGVNDGAFETEGASGGFGNVPASGGIGFYAGGAGGAGATAAEPGDPAGLSVDATGGGGGGVGRVCLRSVSGGISGTGVVSPAPGTTFDLID